MSQIADNTALARAVYDAFGKGDVPAVAGMMAGDIVWMEAEGNPYSDLNPYKGPDKIVSGLFMRLGTEWNGFSAMPDTFIAEGDRVVTLGRYGGTHLATGRKLDSQFAHVWTVRDGKMAAFQQYTDTAQQAFVMGKAG
ncbi:MAG: nuclear transport factor 2 family protein [Alphaproteobacteria bacterium]|nr:nuclear transport factor 2 family protein [Alphaproteobacteria bacterium]